MFDYAVDLRLIDQTRSDWRDRAHFFALASNLIRRILVDHARRARSGECPGRYDSDPSGFRAEDAGGGVVPATLAAVSLPAAGPRPVVRRVAPAQTSRTRLSVEPFRT